MKIFSYSSEGYDGKLVLIETNIFRRSLPGIDIVGLPGGAVRESKVRFRSAIINSGLDFPNGRIIINMVPAGEKKEGACFDLPFACKIISNQIENNNENYLILGELKLDGTVRKVTGILAAVSKAYSEGIKKIIIPKDNFDEAILLGKGEIFPVNTLMEAYNILLGRVKAEKSTIKKQVSKESHLDFSDVMGQVQFKAYIKIER
jgi:magnesium chelatase family protein